MKIMVIAYYRTLEVREVLDYYQWQGVHWMRARTSIGVVDIPTAAARIINVTI